MGKRLDKPNGYGGTTDHSEEIALLRRMSGDSDAPRLSILLVALAADLLEAHDQTGISLDNWMSARLFVETLIGEEIIESGV